MCIVARVCILQPPSQFLYIINQMMLKNDSNAVLITLVLSWVNNFANQFSISLSSSLYTAKIKRGKGG